METNIISKIEPLPNEMLRELKKLLNKDSAIEELSDVIDDNPISIENGEYQITFRSKDELKEAKRILNEN